MAIKFHPSPGDILICNYETGFRAPEMVKRRPVVVVTPRLRRRDGLCTVVPLSTTAPFVVESYQHRIEMERPLPAPWDDPVMWAKADMLATVCFDRLSLIGVGRAADGRRRYIQPALPTDELAAIRRCILHALDMDSLLVKESHAIL